MLIKDVTGDESMLINVITSIIISHFIVWSESPLIAESINDFETVTLYIPSKEKINLTLAVLSRRVVDTGHSICFKKKHYRTVNSVGTPIY